MNIDVVSGLLIPFAGTTLGAAMVFCMRNQLRDSVTHALEGFAAGVMVAASFFSLLAPAIEQSKDMSLFAFVPATLGFLCGAAFLLLLDTVIPHLHIGENEPEGPKTNLKRTTTMVLAVTLHNIPEGMAVGVVYAGWVSGSATISLAGAFSLALGIAIQNFPEGAIISMPLRAAGQSKPKAFGMGMLSGIVEPLAAAVTIVAAHLIVPVLPYLLGFAAGAMMYVVVEELIPEMSAGKHSNLATVIFMLGFALMMMLDVALG
ncbi:MAG: ZIP family metal transporter [Atopobium sp.]|uniref:ZIP family metal transporter n=1 Tax=Atopobium sp. TaxID=1872650 RepID=UPI002A756311|nr:ZIP family metal transporter [Atopobium sp.]MDY2788620.1 ZIP family metal transporter [Atopobium sp.]